MRKTAILLGATGLTGGMLLQNLLSDPAFKKIILFSRHPINIKSPKIEEHVIDLFNLQNYSDIFIGDVVLCCIGTTKAKTPDKETYKKIDYGIPVQAAALSKKNGINRFIVISALGADEKSKVFYNQLKGEMQRDVLSLHIDHTYILQPSLIVGDRNEKRLGENIAAFLMKVFDFLIPQKYKRINAATIARAMNYLALNEYSDTIIPSDKIKEIANSV